jgi:hypothetical protein
MKFENGFYIIKKGTKIYRGDNRMYLGENTWERIKNRPTFFALTKDVAEEEYGVTYEFVTEKDYKLLALDHKQTVSKLLSTITDVNIRNIIELHYGHKSTRNSNLKDDLLITNYLCNKGYEGYATKEMVTDFGGKFHSEIMICNPNFVGLPKQVTVDEQKIQEIIADYKEKRIARRLKEERDEKRKKQRSLFLMEDTEDFDLGFPKIRSSPVRAQSQLFHSPVHAQSQLFHSPVHAQSQLFHSPVRDQSQLFHSPVRDQSQLFHSHIRAPQSQLFHSPVHTNKKNKHRTPTKKGGKNKNKTIKSKSKNKK